MAMPAGRGLFRRVIAQSGAAHHTLPADVAAGIAKRFCELVSVEATDRDAIDWAERHAIPDCHFKRVPGYLYAETRAQEQELEHAFAQV